VHGATAIKDQRLLNRVSNHGLMLARRDEGPRVCVVQPNAAAYSERLIHAHLERLPADVTMLWDAWVLRRPRSLFPEQHWDGKRFLPTPLRAFRRAAHALSPRTAALADRLETRMLAQHLHHERIDVVLAEYGPTGAAVAEACASARVPLVVHFHGYDAHHRATIDKYSEGYRRLFEVAAAIVVVSPTMHAALIALGAPPAKVRLNYPGVDTNHFAGGRPATAEATFVAAGRFVPKKAPHITLAAFAKVVTSQSDARLVMCGDGPLLEATRTLARSWQLGDRVEFRGACSHSAIADLFRTARAFVQHSVHADDGDAEGLPVSLLEAASAGLPIVATRHMGIPEAVIDGKTGFLVREHDVDAMAARMLELAQHADLAGRLGACGRERVLKQFSIERSIDGLWSILAESIRQ
jgi:glycosyltransferase involved in cell wall biosynthesis